MLEGFEAKILGLGTDEVKIIIPKAFVEALRKQITSDTLEEVAKFNAEFYLAIKNLQEEMAKTSSGGLTNTKKLEKLRQEFINLIDSLKTIKLTFE